MLELTLPKRQDFFGDKITYLIELLGFPPDISDVAISTGCFFFDIENGALSSKHKRSGFFWTRDKFDNSSAFVLENNNNRNASVSNTEIGVCPVLNFSSIDELERVLSVNLEDTDYKDIKKGKVYVPLNVAKNDIHKKLQQLLDNKQLNSIYQSRVDFPIYPNEKAFELKDERYNRYYKYKGKLYLLIKNFGHFSFDFPIQLSDDELYSKEAPIFIEVEAVDVYVDLIGNKLYFKDILFSGVPFNKTGSHPKDFAQSDMGQYLCRYLDQIIKIREVQLEIKKSNEVHHVNPTGVESKSEPQSYASNVQLLANRVNQLCDRIAELDRDIQLAKEKLSRLRQQYQKKTGGLNQAVIQEQEALNRLEQQRQQTTDELKTLRELMNQGGNGDAR